MRFSKFPFIWMSTVMWFTVIATYLFFVYVTPEGKLEHTDSESFSEHETKEKQIVNDQKNDSPIDFNHHSVKFIGKFFPALQLNYEPIEKIKLVNLNGILVFAQVPDSSVQCIARFGPLIMPYRLSKIVFHWPSEHTIDGIRFDAEIQIVHFDKTSHKTLEKASKASEGIMIYSVLAKIGQQNDELMKLTENLDYIRIPGEEVVISEAIDFSRILPMDSTERFWTYLGTNTNNDLSKEAVRWIVAANPVDISMKQMQQFKKIYTKITPNGSAKVMFENYHPSSVQSYKQIARSSWAYIS